MRFAESPAPQIPEIWSPSSLNVLAMCGLRSAFDHDNKFRQEFRRDTTYSIMGTASHELTRKVWSGEFNLVEINELQQQLKAEWEQLISAGHQKLISQWAPADVPDPSNWPFYSVRTRATIKNLFDEVVNRRAKAFGASHGSVRVERTIVDEVRGLAGTPDRVIMTGNGFYVLDLKTGTNVESITAEYRRQLLIYAHLISTTTSEPLLGIGVLTARGDVIWDQVDQNSVEEVLDEIQQIVGRFWSAVSSNSVQSLANPSSENCRYCPFRAVCMSYWTSENGEWMDYRGVFGQVLSVIDSRTFTVQQVLPSGGIEEVVGVSNCVHELQAGDVVAVVDGARRGNSIRGNWYTRAVKVSILQD